jgi:excinuclease ABC subunit A
MDFLPDLKIGCDQCRGRRYRDEILAITFQARDISGILEMTVAEAALFFGAYPAIASGLAVLKRTGLDYLTLGQSLESLSGGEAQRLGLAAELIHPGRGTTVWLFEEPTAGLHFRDIGYLITLFRELADAGNLLLVVDSDPQVVAVADRVVTLGPGSGNAGGYLL